MVPRGDSSGEPIQIRLDLVARAQVRIDEIAALTLQKAPELLVCFNKAWLDMSRAVNIITVQKLKAMHAKDRAWSDALLGATDQKVKERGHTKSSADLRRALAENDPTFIKTRETLDEISVYLQYCKDKQKAFENAFSAVKKLTDSRQLPNPNLNNPPTKLDEDDDLIGEAKI